MKPSYSGFTRNKFGERVFVAFQGKDTESRPTITNAVEYISRYHGVDSVLYLDSTDHWTGWNTDVGFFEVDKNVPNRIGLPDSVFKRFWLKLKLLRIEKGIE
jgi:hypothetical protein